MKKVLEEKEFLLALSYWNICYPLRLAVSLNIPLVSMSPQSFHSSYYKVEEFEKENIENLKCSEH